MPTSKRVATLIILPQGRLKERGKGPFLVYALRSSHAMENPVFRFVFLSAFLALAASAELRLAGLFSDHMVVQQRRAVPVWGWAKPKARVVVRLERNTATTTALEDGS